MQETGLVHRELTEYARSKVSGPAIALIVCCVVSIIVCLLALCVSAWLLVSGVAGELPDPAGIPKEATIVVRMVWNVVIQIANVIIIVGAFRMRNLRNLGLSRTACILALIPCVGPCLLLGIPFGVWGLTVLNDPKVRQAFDG